MPETNNTNSKAKKTAGKVSGKNTSKTARVLGLLTSSMPAGEDAAPAQPEQTASVEEKLRSALEQEVGTTVPLSSKAASTTFVPAPMTAQEPDPAHVGSQLTTEEAAKSHRIICFNIMQMLVEDKAGKYMELFGLCTCPRCRIDVIALALTNLPPKYAAVEEDGMVPLLTQFEARYSSEVAAQLVNACKQVQSRPHHER